MNIKEIAQKLRDRLNKYDNFTGLWVYGSRVNGTPRHDSDLDTVAIFKKRLSYQDSLNISGEVLDLELEYNIPISTFKMTEEELNLNYMFYDEVKKGLYYGAK